MRKAFAIDFILTDVADVALVIAEDVELGKVAIVWGADSGGATDDGIGMMGGGGGAVAAIASLAIVLFLSMGSNFITGDCWDMTIGCGGGGADVFIIGLICVDPTFIVGAFAGDCWSVLITADVFNIFAVTELNTIECSIQVQLFNDE